MPHLDLPSDLDPNSPEFIPALNEALRRVAATGATTTQLVRIGGSAGGAGGGAVAEGYALVPVSEDNHATPDLALGRHQQVTLDRPLTTIDVPLHAPGPMRWTLILVQDSTGEHAVAFAADYVGTGAVALNSTGDTYSSIEFVIRPDGKSALASVVSGVPVS